MKSKPVSGCNEDEIDMIELITGLWIKGIDIQIGQYHMYTSLTNQVQQKISYRIS